jgi:ubiquitin C-terminal hydrolase
MGGLLRGIGGFMSSGSSSSSAAGARLGVLDCLRAFTEDEVLQGTDTFACPRCKAKGAATKRLRVRNPKP